jgi:DNA/RNA-binding domain of Phe-tRNA-synthetase-like protein
MISVAPHPLLAVSGFRAEFPVELAEIPSPDWLLAGLSTGWISPWQGPGEGLRGRTRDLLRHGGFKPTGRSKPASEYLARAAGDGTLGSINAVVDACNVASLHSGLPISVVDLDRVQGALRIEIALPGSRYVFNASGQEIDIAGLVVLADDAGPCANAVKDSQRTKTHGGTRRVAAVCWAHVEDRELGRDVSRWYADALARLGAAISGTWTGP